MSLKLKYEDENDKIDNEKIVSLGNEQIKSVLKIQSEAIFQDKNISNNSSFIKKSLIDIALDFESKQEEEKNLSSKSENLNSKQVDADELQTEQTKIIDKNDEIESIENHNETLVSIENTDTKTLLSDEIIKDNSSKDTTNNKGQNENQFNEDLVKHEANEDNNKKTDLKSEDNKDVKDSIQGLEDNTKETQQALNSVRDAVSQSINKSDNDTAQTHKNLELTSDEVTEVIVKDIESYKNIFSSLSSMSEKAIYDVMENKILDIANELAGYQIDKMPDKYEKKIKTFLKNINCFEEKITIEVNDKDLESLSKIENFQNINKKSQFVPNKDISRGDIILNCDGMRYSEKTLKKD
jgi:hypothetical protein